jgi:hypothetical protein
MMRMVVKIQPVKIKMTITMVVSIFLMIVPKVIWDGFNQVLLITTAMAAKILLKI